MKRYIKQSSTRGVRAEEYKGTVIYKDESTGYIYVYTQPRGEGRMEFESIREAKEYIDSIDSNSQPLIRYRVWYQNSVFNNNNYTEVEARNEADARKQAKKRIGRELVKVIKVEVI